jgi:DNA repair protein RecN (Recombination protein N)
MKAVGAALVEIHGQHDERALVDAGTHRRLLDAFGGLEAQACEVERLWGERRSKEAEAQAHRAEVERARREADWLRHAVEELTRLAPEPSEETMLAEKRTAMMQVEKVAGDLRDAQEAVSGSQSPVPALSAAVRRLERRAVQVPALIEPAVRAIDVALNALEEARTHLEHALRTADHDPRELERIEERLFALRAASRKYGVSVDGLNALAARHTAELALIDAGAERLAVLEKAAREALEFYRAAAAALSQARRKCAQKLDKAVNAELKPLRLERAKFSTEIATEPEAAGAHGIDRIEFWVRTNPGTRPGPLMKVASGGELARFLLALKVVLADRGSAPTLIFDEIDTGVGGAVADAIGLRLARLSRRAQVVAVTHAPQVAARADRHYLISKSALDKGKRVATRVAELAAEKRREEIARMLAGAEITAEARAAAERLIKAAG